MAKGSFNPKKTIKIGLLAKTDSTQTRVQIQVFDDHSYLDVRQWYKKKGDEEYKPGKGTTIPLKKMKRMRKLLKLAIDKADELGLLDEEE